MKWCNLVAASVLSLSFAAQAASQETQTSEVFSLMSEMQKLHAQFDGKTATLSGGLGTIVGDIIFFQSDLGRFMVQFDAGREARRLIEGCRITIFGNVESRCVFEVDVELRVAESYNLANGGEITLIVYNVRQ